jgi:murein DD-endopeptidase MepM/ murein hydrolase activator NlpD
MAPAGTPAQVVDIANLRLGPSEADEILRVLPAGASLTITGAASGGYTPVWYNGTWGFVSDSLLAAGQAAPVTMAQEAVPQTQDAVPTEMSVDDGSGDLVATTLSDINLRSGPSYNDMVLGIIPAGVALYPYAGQEAGFYQVDANGQTGWVAAEFLQVSVDYEQKARQNRDQEGKVENSEPAGNADASYGGGIIWPVSGGSWAIMQGYNGSSHQNQDSLWQYYYSLDLVRQDGETAGQTVYSPVNGVVRWTDPGSGGMSIDMGDGHAVAMFHVAFDGSLQAGTPVSQGQAIGTISGSGGPGFAGTPHLHFTLWTSDDSGNWDREAEPFTGKYAIAGMDFPDTGGSSQYAGTTFNP